jgi:hypothetical protein
LLASSVAIAVTPYSYSRRLRTNGEQKQNKNKKLVTVTHLIYELTIFKQPLKKVNIIPPIILALLINIVMNTLAPVVPPGMKDKK